MTSLRPYLIRALYDWILDNSFTPYLLVNAECEEIVVPQQYIQEGRIVLNMRPEAIHDLVLGNEQIVFSARFEGKPMQVEIPIYAVLAIYAQENGKGMIFDEGEDNIPPPGDSKPRPTRPELKIVK